MELALFCTIEIETSPAVATGPTPLGQGRMVPLIGGTFRGTLPGLLGRVVGGTDFQEMRANGTIEISARYMLETTAGAVIEVESLGIRSGSPDVMNAVTAGDPVDPSAYYFRTSMRFRTGDPQLAVLNDRLFVAIGYRRLTTVELDVFVIH